MPTRCGLLAEGFRDNIKFGLELGNCNWIDDQTLVPVSVCYSFTSRQFHKATYFLALRMMPNLFSKGLWFTVIKLQPDVWITIQIFEDVK